jgi:hypothetical protein
MGDKEYTKDDYFKDEFAKGEDKPHSFCETPEEKCAMNYCDTNGCQNRKRELVEPKPETLEEFIKEQLEGYDEIDFSTYETYIELGVKWQQEQDKKMYSEGEVIEIVEKSRATGLTAEFLILTKQFKK